MPFFAHALPLLLIFAVVIGPMSRVMLRPANDNYDEASKEPESSGEDQAPQQILS